MNIVEKIANAGVIGAGGAGFPTHVKLNSKAEYVLLNGAECEPLLRVDQQLMEYYPEKIIEGLYEAGKFVEAEKAIIGIKKKHKEVIEILNAKIEEMGLSGKVEVGILPDVYPAGDEQVLVYELTGRVVPELGIPIAVGCVVINTETALNIYNAIRDIPVTMKYITIAGDVPCPVTVKVPVGTPIVEVLAMAGVLEPTAFEIIDGGPMMGPLMKDVGGYVTKKTKGLVVLRKEHSLVARKKREMKSACNLNKTACEQCRMCTDLCPRYLLGHSTSPHKMVRAVAYGAAADENVTVAQTCCQCNLCEYFSCPAGISPKMANVYFMGKLREKNIRHKSNKTEFKPREMREYRMVPSKRLIARLELDSFDKAAPLDAEKEYMPEVVGISLTSHVGAGAKALVNVGDHVEAGQLIGDVEEGSLGAKVHASIRGTVSQIDGNCIVIRRE